MGAMDSNRNVTVADARLAISEFPENVVFMDGFESGDLTHWSVVNP